MVSRGILKSCLQLALEKYCFHTVCDSFFVQTHRLEAVRYPDSELVAVSQVQKEWVKRNGEAMERVRMNVNEKSMR